MNMKADRISLWMVSHEDSFSYRGKSQLGNGHSCPQRPRSFWSAPRITTYGQPLAGSNTRSPPFPDFPSLCACSESSLTNLIGSSLILLCLQSQSEPESHWTYPEVMISWCWPKGARPLGTRMENSLFKQTFCTCAGHANLNKWEWKKDDSILLQKTSFLLGFLWFLGAQKPSTV